MSKTKISEYSSVASDNTDIGGINIAEGMAPSDVNNAMRTQMAQLKEFLDGSSGDTITTAKIVATTAEILSGVSVTGTATFNSAIVLSSSITGSALSLSGALTVGGAAIMSSTLGVTGTASMGVIDATTLEVTNIKAKDGTASVTIADSTGVFTIASAVLTTADVNGGTLDDVIIGAGTPAAGTFTIGTATTFTATTVDSTNLEVTNLKAKDGTSAGSIADSTGVFTINSAVLTTADINGGTADDVAIGAGTPSTGAFTTLSSSSTTTLNGTTIPASETLLVSTDIGTTVQGYDADTAKYDDTTANFTGTLQNGGSNVVVDSDIGSTVQAYSANLDSINQDLGNTDSPTFAALNISGNLDVTGVISNAGNTVLNTGDIGVTVQGYDATIVVDADIGVTVQAYDADTAKYDDATANFVGTLQNGGSNVVVDTDIGSTVQAYSANLDSINQDLGNTDSPTFAGITSTGNIDATGVIKQGANVVLDTADIGVSVQAYDATILVDADIGVSVQAYDAQLADVAGLTPADGAFIVGDGANFVAESGSTARTSLGLGSMATQADTNVDINGGAIDAITLGTNSAVTEAQVDNININGNTISSTDTDGDLNLTPNGAGDLVLDGLKWPQSDGAADYVLKTNGAGQLAWTEQTGGGGGITTGKAIAMAIVFG
jgi:hypothetical protein